MHVYSQLYEFAASAGAWEGFVYGKDLLDEAMLAKWSDNILRAYQLLPPDVLREIQPSCDGTLGRAIHSLRPVLGEDHEIIGKLKSMTAGPLPRSADDFQKTKWFQR